MANWRRQTSDNYGGYGGYADPKSRSMIRKPPRGVNNWQSTVPHWEKRFCKVVGDMDWETFLDSKRFVHLYQNVFKWNDSAGEEAFYNAKERFLAKINGWPCEIPLPSPDLYIDKVDWDAKFDEDPLLELEYNESLVPKENREPVVIFGDALIRNLGLSTAGWGDEGENGNKPVEQMPSNLGISPTGWGDEDEQCKKAVDSSWDNYQEPMPSNLGITPTGWGDDDEKCNKAVDSSWDNIYDKKPIQIKETAFENDWYVGPDHHNANTGWEDDNWRKIEGTRKNDIPKAWQVNNNNSWENKNYGQQYKPSYQSSRFMDTGWDDDWLKMEGTAGKSNAPGTTWQVNSNWGNKNSGQHKARYETSRFVENNTYCNKGRYKWRSGSNYGKREAIVN